MRALVTGGAGFIGSHLVDELVSAGHSVAVIDNLSSGLKQNIHKKADFIRCDIKDKKVRGVFEKVRPEVVFHLAAQKNVGKSLEDPLFDAEENIIGSLNIFENCKKFRAKIIFSSTVAVYGEADVFPTSEQAPQKPVNPYGVAKLSVENYLFYYHKVYHQPYLSLRYANVYGPRQDPQGEAGVVAVFLRKLMDKESPIINGQGEQTRDFIYVSDVVAANIRAMQSDWCGEINIGTGQETSVNQLFNKINELGNYRREAKHGPVLPGDLLRSVLSCQSAKKIFNWQAQINLEEGLARTIDWFRKNIN